MVHRENVYPYNLVEKD